jgi:hypothetical protein
MAVRETPNRAAPVTIYPAPYYPIYKAYKVIGGWVVTYVQDRYTVRPIDGSKVHKSRQNAYAKAKRLNDRLQQESQSL